MKNLPLPLPLSRLRQRLDAFRRFVYTETGAVTVDWTVLAAAVVGLGLASVAAVRSGVVDLGNDVGGSLSGAQVAALGSAAPRTPAEILAAFSVTGCPGGLQGIHDFGMAAVALGMHLDSEEDVVAHMDGVRNASDQTVLDMISEHRGLPPRSDVGRDIDVVFATAYGEAQSRGLI